MRKSPSKQRTQRTRPKGFPGPDSIQRQENLSPMLYSSDNLTKRRQASPAEAVSVLRISHVLSALKRVLLKSKNVKVLEIGAGSGRLAKHLIYTKGIRPENYTIADLDYVGKGKGPFIVKEIQELVRTGRMRKIRLNALEAPSEQIGKFNVILLPNVLPDGFLSSSPRRIAVLKIARNYAPLVEKGGCIIMNRVTSIDFKELEPDLSKLGFSFERAVTPSPGINGYALFLWKK